MPRFTTCEFVNSNGRSCGSPAMRNRHFCYYHLRALPSRRDARNTNRERSEISNNTRTRNQLDRAVSKVMTRVMNNGISTQQAAALVCAIETAYETNTGLKAELL